MSTARPPHPPAAVPPEASSADARARAALCRLVAERGVALAADSSLLQALLADECGDARQANTLVCVAAEERVPADLSASHGEPLIVLIPRLATRLARSRGLDIRSARWAVDSWALALALATPEALAAIPLPPLPGGMMQRLPEPVRAVANLLVEKRRAIGVIVAVLVIWWVGREVLDQVSNAGALRALLPPQSGAVHARAARKDNQDGVEFLIPVQVGGAKFQRCELGSWINYRSGGKVMARTPRGAYATPDGQMSRMQFWFPRWHDESSVRAIFFPASEFPLRDAGRAVQYDLVMQFRCAGQVLIGRTRVPIVFE